MSRIASSGLFVRSSICVAIALVAAIALAADEKAAEADLSRLQGEWAMSSGTADGYPIPDQMLPNFKRVCKGNEVTVTNGEQLIMKAKITVDPSKNPKTIDYEVIDGPTKDKKHLGIYQLDGDTLKSCFGAPDKERPTDFSSKTGDLRTASVWKRAKKP